MVRIENPLQHDFIKAECFGQPNTGKSTFAYSICKIKPKIPTKKTIVLFVNDPTYLDALKNFVDHIDNFDILEHRSLEEFEADWDTFVDDYRYKTEYVGTKAVMNTDYIMKNVHAIIMDEGEFIYREGYVARHARALNKKTIDLKPSDYGVPRSDFTVQINRMAMLPCHFILCSKVGSEYREERYIRVSDGQPGAMQWKKTGADTYRLPDNVLYMPSLSMHLFKHETPIMETFTDEKDGKQYQVPKTDEFGKKLTDDKYYGRARKQKADREKDFVVQNPTMSKVMLKLRVLQDQVRKRGKIE